MGMSASQARLLSLQARQSNLEYQGQQINQERTVLSQQCTALYNSLLAMTVPTPPSTNDYTTIEYSGTDGATTFTIGTVKPSGDLYNVEIQQSATGAAITSNYGSSVVGNAGSTMNGTYIDTVSLVKDGTYSQVQDGSSYEEGDVYINEKSGAKGSDLKAEGKDPSDYMVMDSENGYVQAESFEDNQTYYVITSKEDYDKAENKQDYSQLRDYPSELATEVLAKDIESGAYYVKLANGNVEQLNISSPYVNKEANGKYTFKLPEDALLFKKGAGSETLENPNEGAVTIAGNVAYDFKTASQMDEFSSFDWEKYREAIRNSYGASDASITEDDFYVFVVTSETGVRSMQFALKSDVDSPDKFAETFSYTPNGKYTTSNPTDKCQLEFDSQGRINKIGIPTVDSTTGEVTSYRYIDLTAETVTDESAYQDAYNKYEYAQYEYDKTQQEINAKTSIIQQEDRNLELKLQRLDNERTQITTEIEAVDKVINDNIEASYKTFSG